MATYESRNMDEPPPTTHTLRPHHVSLLMIIMILYRQYERPKFHPEFLLHVVRVLMVEIAEVSQPKSYEELVTALAASPHSKDGSQGFFESLNPVYAANFASVDHLTNFFHGISYLFVDTKTGEESDLHRRSFLGYFCRRCFVTFVKLSFAGVAQLRDDYHAWLFGHPGGYEKQQNDLITFDKILLKTHADDHQWAEPEAYAIFERGVAIADSNIASEAIRRFFEQHFHEGSDSGTRQHALLNLARMHYLRHEYAASRQYLTEAIEIARIANDHWGLQHSLSLMHRLPPIQKDQKPIINEIQAGLHPLEVLFDVEKLIRVSSNQPLSASFEKIIQATGLYDLWIGMQNHVFEESELLAPHAVQSIVWRAAGCERLAAIEEDYVTAFSDIGSDDNNVITVTLNRAYRRARQGEYEDAISMLLEPDVWCGLAIHDYARWASQIWHILVLRASRRGQERQYNDFLKPRFPGSTFSPREYFYNVSTPMSSIIRDPLYEVLQMRRVDQAVTSVEPLLKALWYSEFQCRYGSYRTGIILLADVGLEFGMTKRSQRIVEEIMPQVINGDDLEQRALACFVFARCILAAGEQSRDSMTSALPYLSIAERDYATLQMFRSLADVQYLKAVLYHNLHKFGERDETAARQLKTEEDMDATSIIVMEEWIAQVWELVCDVGAALAAR
ncbi:hypothetical protein FA95DRAFT_1560450 [Auriscalpium vulgare]|uniref:Uncharacterized protein n=1 Tax=Auriscalpium vulgare TaxID=40419 RepID=A0ACB8RQD5_9AGAM|nr:hypothetical protein FA95DRAFT_1560450 [Auriscalpium vulgare]